MLHYQNSTVDFYSIKLKTPYSTWQRVKIEIGMSAMVFFLSMAKNKNARQGGMVSPSITSVFVMPL